MGLMLLQFSPQAEEMARFGRAGDPAVPLTTPRAWGDADGGPRVGCRACMPDGECASPSSSAAAAREHAISCVSAGSVLAALDPDRVRGGAGRHHARRRLGARPRATRRRCASTGRALPDGRRTAPRWCCPATRPPAGWSWSSPARAGAGAARAWTWSSRCCTGRTARTAPSRACWRWPACRTWAPGVLASAAAHGQGVHQEAAGRRGPAGRAVRGGAAGRHGDADRRRTASGSACRCSSSRPAAGRRSGSAGSTTGPSCRRRSPRPAAADPKVLVEAAVPGGRSSSRCWRARRRGRRT